MFTVMFPVRTLLFLHPRNWYIVFSFSTSSIFPKKFTSGIYYCAWFEAGIYLMSFSSAEWCFPSPDICWDSSVTHHRVCCVSQSSVSEMVLVRMSLRNGLPLLPGTPLVTNCNHFLSLAFYFFIKLVVFPG